MTFATLKREKKLGRVHFRKVFWDCYWGQGKQIDQQLTCASPVRIPKFFAKANSSQRILAGKNFITFTSATDHKNRKICNTTLVSYSYLSTEHWIIMARRLLTVVVRLPDVSPASITGEKLHKPSTRFTIVLHYYTNTATPILCVRSVEKHYNCYCLLQQLHYTVVPTYLS